MRVYRAISSNRRLGARRGALRALDSASDDLSPHAQPADIADVLLHETATSWLRGRLVKTGASLTQPWRESPAEFAARMQRDIRDTNGQCDVEGLCHEFRERLQDMSLKTLGDRLKK